MIKPTRAERWLPIALGVVWWAVFYPGLFGEDSLITLDQASLAFGDAALLDHADLAHVLGGDPVPACRLTGTSRSCSAAQSRS